MSLSETRLLAIAGPPIVELGALTDACSAAAAGGVTAVQLRIKDVAAGRLLELTQQLVEALPIPVWVNDRADVALAAGARGVHVGADDVPADAVRRFAGEALRVGVSVGSPAEADAALRADVDYWSIGSIWATSTKPDAGAPIGAAGFRKLAALAPEGMRVIAIGGITAGNAAEIIAAGAQGIAVSSAVFAAPDIEAAARRLRASVDSALVQLPPERTS
ncbi:MAG: thiamine phosphate synthase [Gemmatimonadales bacterium]